ncbi:MAG: RNA polymerase sigma factor [Spirochaetia bacterium]|nr:RNA polymerase sigma factor [Spirochaetia bacterium]
MNTEEYIKEIYEKTNEQIYRYLVRLVGIENADDILQETWEKFIVNIDKGKIHKGTEKSWLYKVSHNAAMDFYRKRKRLVQDDDLFLNIAEEKSSGDNIFEKLKREDLKDLLYKLSFDFDKSGKSTTLIYLLKENKYTQKEISQIMNKSERTIRRMIDRLFKHLEKKLIELEINVDFLHK